MHATSTSNSTLDSASLAAGFGAVAGVLLDSTVATTTEAYIGDGANVTSSGTIDINAHANNTVKADSASLQISLAGGTVTDILSKDDSNVNTRIGPAEGAGSGSATVNSSGNITANSLLDSNVKGWAISANLSVIGNIGIITGKAENSADVRSYLGRSTSITSPNSAVSFTATSHSTVYSQAIGFAGSGTFSGNDVNSIAKLLHTAKAFTDSGGSINAASISFTANANNDNLTAGTDCASNFGACAKVTGGAVSLLASVALNSADATDSPTVKAYVQGTVLTASTAGSVNVISNVKQKAMAEVLSVSIGGAFGAGATSATAITEGTTETFFNGTVAQAGTVTVRSNVDFTVRTDSQNISASLVGSGAISTSNARIGKTPPASPPEVATYVGGSGSITATNDVRVWSVVNTSAYSENEAIGGALLASVRSVDTTTTVQPTIRTYADGGAVIASTLGSVYFLAAHNYDPDAVTPGFVNGNTAVGSAGSYGGGLIDLDIGTDINVTTKADVDTTIKGGATSASREHGQGRVLLEERCRFTLRERGRRRVHDPCRRGGQRHCVWQDLGRNRRQCDRSRQRVVRGGIDQRLRQRP